MIRSSNWIGTEPKSCWKHPSKKSEVSNLLIINVYFWFFRLIFMIWNNQELFDDWFFQNPKFSVKSQKLVLWINQLSPSDFFEGCFSFLLFFSFLFFPSDRDERRTEYAAAKFYFAAANLKNASAFGVKRLGVLIEMSKRFGNTFFSVFSSPF
jgi:hypothetical protein